MLPYLIHKLELDCDIIGTKQKYMPMRALLKAQYLEYSLRWGGNQQDDGERQQLRSY